MTNQLETLLDEAIDENRKEKILLIEDITKAKTLLFGLGETQHNEFQNTDSAAELWLELYDMDFDQLTLIRDGYEAKINLIAIQKLKAGV